MNPLLSHLQPYPFERLRQLFAGIAPAAAYSPISLGMGEPRHPTPQFIKDVLCSNLGGLASYPATAGEPRLREAFAGWIHRRYAVSVDPGTQVLPVNGSREALFAFAQTIIRPSAGQPRVVCRDDIDGNTEYLFGSVVEAGLLKFDRTSIAEWPTVVATLCDASLFTVALASALCLGNDDHHADNWLVRDTDPANGILCHSLVPMDFGNAWPACNPAHHPMRHPSPNTWEITRHWRAMGITFDQALFRLTCARMQILDRHWLQAVLTPLLGIWLTAEKHDALCDWWQQHWRDQVVGAVYSLEPDGDWL